MTKRRAWGVLLAVTLAAWMTAGIQAADDVLNLVPQDALGFGVVHHLGESDAKIQKLGQQMQAPIPGVLDQAKATTGLKEGLDEKGSVAAIVLNGEDAKAEPVVVLAVPVTRYDTFLKQLKPEKEAQEGISEVTVLGADFLTAPRGNFALMAEPKHRAALKKVLESKQSLAAKLGTLQPWLAEKDAAVVITDAGVKLIAAQGLKALGQARESVMPEPSMLGIYEGFLKRAEKEVALVAGGLQADKEGSLFADGRVQFVAGSQTAGLLEKTKPAQDNLVAGLPGGTYVFALGALTPRSLMEDVTAFSVDMMKQNPKLYGLTPEQVDKMMEIYRKSMADMEAFSMLMKIGKRGEPIYGNIFGTIRVKNAEQYLADYEKQLAEVNDMLKDVKEGLMKPMQVKKTELGGKPAIELEMALPLPPEMAGEEKVLEALFGPGGKIKMDMVAADEHTIVMGYNTSKDLVVKAMDYVKNPDKGLGADPDVAKTAALLPAGSQWVGYLSPRGMVALIARVFSEFAPTELGIQVPEFPKTPTVGLGVKASENLIEARVVVPAAVLEAIGKYQAAFTEQMNPQVP